MPDFVASTAAALARAPRVLAEMVSGLPEPWLGVPDVEGGWTARDVAGHLITTETGVWQPRLELICAGGEQEFAPFDRFAHVERDRGVALDALVDRFAGLRAASLQRLAELVPDDTALDRAGRHPQFGRVTLRQFLAAWTVHDLDHVAQAVSSLAASRDAEVGPWKANLGILLRRDGQTAS